MKNFLNQFYNEGLATTFIKKPKSFINKHIKNKTINKILSILITIFYTILALGFAAFYLYKKLK